MKKLLFLLFLLPQLALAQIGGSSGISFSQNAIGAPYSKPCATNYIRTGPNFCLWVGNGLSGFNSISTACTSVPAPAGAVAAFVGIEADLVAANSVAARTGQLFFYNDATCVTNIGQLNFQGQEFVATTASTTIYKMLEAYVVPVVSGNLVAKNGTVASTISIWIIGYFD